MAECELRADGVSVWPDVAEQDERGVVAQNFANLFEAGVSGMGVGFAHGLGNCGARGADSSRERPSRKDKSKYDFAGACDSSGNPVKGLQALTGRRRIFPFQIPPLARLTEGVRVAIDRGLAGFRMEETDGKITFVGSCKPAGLIDGAPSAFTRGIRN